MKKIRKQIEQVREHLAVSDRAGGDEQELRELRAAVSMLSDAVERLADR